MFPFIVCAGARDLGVHEEVEIEIAVGRACPAEVLVHGLVDEFVPFIAVVPEQACRAEDGVAHLVSVEVGEGEARALAGELVVGDHRVLEAAGLADHRERAVAHGDDLRQAAGFEQ